MQVAKPVPCCIIQSVNNATFVYQPRTDVINNVMLTEKCRVFLSADTFIPTQAKSCHALHAFFFATDLDVSNKL